MVLAILHSCGNAETSSTESNTSTTDKTTEALEQAPEVAQTPTVKILGQSDLASKLTEENVLLIDVRTPGEVSDGYIKGAHKFININDADFLPSIDELDKEKTYVMYCRSGGRSGKAANIMVQKGFKDVYNLEGGILNFKGEIAK